MMTNRERLACAMRGEKPDRVPVSIYQHSTALDRGVDAFVDYTLRFHTKFEPDYVKVMYDELYDAPVNFQFATDISVWDILDELDPHKAAFGRCLEALKQIRDRTDPDTPVLGTVFSPFHIAVRLAWTRLTEDCRVDEERVIRGLATISHNVTAFVKAAIAETGIDGFLLGGYGGEPGWLTKDEYLRIAAPFDRDVVAAMASAPFSIIHAHGGKDVFIDLFASYECKALSWEDRHGGLDLRGARAITGKCLVGGVDHIAVKDGGPALARSQALEAIAATEGRGFILAPGCTFLPDTQAETMLALKAAALEAAERPAK